MTMVATRGRGSRFLPRGRRAGIVPPQFGGTASPAQPRPSHRGLRWSFWFRLGLACSMARWVPAPPRPAWAPRSRRCRASHYRPGRPPLWRPRRGRRWPFKIGKHYLRLQLPGSFDWFGKEHLRDVLPFLQGHASQQVL